MNPSEGFWEGVGASVGQSPGWMVIGAILVIGIIFITAKYIWPGHERIKMKQLEIQQKQAENDAERNRVNAMIAENMEGLRASNDSLATQTAAMTARLNESAERSRDMGSEVHHIRDTTDSTSELVRDIHHHMLGGEGTD